MNNQKSPGNRGVISNSTAVNFRARWKAVAAGLMMTGLAASPALAGFSVSTVMSFNGTNGASPNYIFRANDGNFYGTTFFGGTNGSLGTVFELTSGGVFKSLLSFNFTNGVSPVGLMQATDGNFYGTTLHGGSNTLGTVFRLSTDGTLTNLVVFNGTNGSSPQSGLVQDPVDGNLYGTTSGGGSNTDGTVFQLTTNGVFKTLVAFNDANGANPYGLLCVGTDGTLYGTTYFGGTNGENGTVFSISLNGAFTSLFSFDGASSGANPYAGLLLGADGNFYGTTSSGGSSFDGSFFQVTSNGTLTTLVSFNSTNGASPYGILTEASGAFYGTTLYGGTNDAGTLFVYGTNTLTSLYSFGANSNLTGLNPEAGLVSAGNGNYYGVASTGGATNLGTLFLLSSGNAPLQPITLTITQNGTALDIGWNSQPTVTYQLQSTTDPTLVNWTNFGGTITATQTNTTETDTLGSIAQKFYRVTVAQ